MPIQLTNFLLKIIDTNIVQISADGVLDLWKVGTTFNSLSIRLNLQNIFHKISLLKSNRIDILAIMCNITKPFKLMTGMRQYSRKHLRSFRTSERNERL